MPLYLCCCNALVWLYGVGACPQVRTLQDYTDSTHPAQFIVQYLPVLVVVSSPFFLPTLLVSFSKICRLPNSEFATLFRLGRFHRCCLSGRTLSMKKVRILMSCGTLKGDQAAPLSLKSPHATHHLQSLSSRPLPIESPRFRAFCSTAD